MRRFIRIRKGTTFSLKRKKIGGNPQLYTPREKLQNYIWVFKKGDADDHPSIPHAHSKEEGYRLDAWTGDIYPKGNERKRTIGKLNSKELARLHSNEGFLDFAKEQIVWYRQSNPHINFFVPDWFALKMNQPKLSVKQEIKQLDGFVFYGKASIREEE